MELKFYKYQGCGNDFIIVLDNPQNATFQFDEKTIKKLCDRHFGIGADGLIRILPDEQYDFRMIYYNSDGKESSMCGNGGRCAILFAYHQQWIGFETNFIAIDGIHQGWITPSGVGVSLQVTGKIHQRAENEFYVHTGSPHIVRWVSNINKVDMIAFGRSIRFSEEFYDEGVNVNAVEILSDNKLYVRTYERGVENETLSCGTGIAAAAWVYASLMPNQQKVQKLTSKISVLTSGGNFQVFLDWSDRSTNPKINLFGDAKKVFEGKLEW